MEGHAVQTHEPATSPVFAGRWRDVALLAGLLALALSLRGWLLFNTEVPARDTIGFIRYALEFETDPWWQVLRNNHQHPAYPLSILAVSVPVRAVYDAPEAEVMSFSAQLASNLAAVLLVIPMFYLGKLLFHRAAGFGAAALVQCLPVSGHIISDGLSEALFLLLASSTLCFAVLATGTRRPSHYALCGLFGGLAYLTRPEGALVIASTGLVLLFLGRLTGEMVPWRQKLSCLGCLAGVAILVGSPYVLATQRISNKPSVSQWLGKELPELDQQPLLPPPPPPRAEARTPLLGCLLGVALKLDLPWHKRVVNAVWYLGGELVKCFHYAAWVPAVLGMWWFRRRAFAVPGMWVLLVLCVVWSVVLCRLAVQSGYMSDRHLMLLVMCGSYAASAAIWELPCRVSAWIKRQPWPGVAGGPVAHTQVTAAIAVLMLPGFLAAGMPKALETLHGNRAGYHAAGYWLSQNAHAEDVIEDEHCWAQYYSGRVFQERGERKKTAGYRPTRFIVLGRRERDITLTWNRPGLPSESKIREAGGRIVYHWPATSTPQEAPIVIYAIAPR